MVRARAADIMKPAFRVLPRVSSRRERGLMAGSMRHIASASPENSSMSLKLDTQIITNAEIVPGRDHIQEAREALEGGAECI